MKIYRYGKSIEKLGQRYRLDGSLGNGGMADICLAWDEKNHREVAIKILKTNQLDLDMLNRFIHEGSLIRSWQHPHIIQIYDDVRMELLDSTTGSSIPYLIMEYLRGGTLEDRLKADRPYPFPQTLLLFDQLCNALQYAHEHGVIHRDLKPSNILFKNPPNTPDHLVLSDFGLAVSMLATHHTFSHGGTPLYMAPEQLLRGKTVPASDIFALGVILYRLCTGRMPFQLIDFYKVPLSIPPAPSSIHNILPKKLDQVILTALSEDPQQRHANAQIFWQCLQEAITADMRERQSPVINLLPKPVIPLVEENKTQPSHKSEQIPESPPMKEITRDDNILNLPLPTSQAALNNHTEPNHALQQEESQKETIVNEAAVANPPMIRPISQQRPLVTLEPPIQALPRGKDIRRRTYRPLALILLITLSLLLCTSLALANPSIVRSVIPDYIPLPGIPGATISITPASQIVSNTYIITNNTSTPDPKRQTIKAHNISSTAQSQMLKVIASGHQKTTGKQATGILTFSSNSYQTLTIERTTFRISNGLTFTMKTSVTIPASSGGAITKATVIATADAVGTAGNIPTLTIDQPCCTTGVSVTNRSDFTGGLDPGDYNFITQADIDSVATQAIQNQVTQTAANQLKSQLTRSEILATPPQCLKSISSNNPVGDQGQNVDSTLIIVIEHCSSVAYDDQEMHTLLTRLLTQDAQASPGPGYVLQDKSIITTTIQSTNPIILNVKAKRLWVYRFDTQRQKDLLNLIKGKMVEAAKVALLNAKGVANVTIQYSGTTLPTDVNQMTLITQIPLKGA